MSDFYQRHKLWVWGAIWVLTRALIVAQIGFLNHRSVTSLEDVFLYETWAETLAHDHSLPVGELWQYPPGAALLLPLAELGMHIKGFGPAFAGLMLGFDFLAFCLIAVLARRQRRDTGVWIWLLGIPMLRAVPLLRFDMVGTSLAIAALFVIHRRPAWFGALAGLGAAIKVWPVILLFGEWKSGRLLRAAAAAAAAIVLVFAVVALAFSGNVFEFLTEQGGRGLHVEAVGSLPWHLREIVTGEGPRTLSRSGASEIASGPADLIAGLLKVATLAVLVAAAVWWRARRRAIDDGRRELADATVSRDFVFTLALLLVVASQVLSPQYLIWLLGLAAVALTNRSSVVARPAWIVVAAAIVSTAAYGHKGAWGHPPVYGSSFNLVIRNVALLVAAVDASALMWKLPRRPRPPGLSGANESESAAPNG